MRYVYRVWNWNAWAGLKVYTFLVSCSYYSNVAQDFTNSFLIFISTFFKITRFKNGKNGVECEYDDGYDMTRYGLVTI